MCSRCSNNEGQAGKIPADNLSENLGIYLHFLLPEDKKSSILTGKKFPETDEDRGDYLHIRVPSFFFTEEGESPAISLNILLKCDKSLNPQE